MSNEENGDDEEFLRRKDAAKLAGRSPKTIDHWASEGKLAKFTDGLGFPLYRKSDVLALTRPRPVSA